MPDFSPQPIHSPLKPIGLCKWTNCEENCQAGFKEVPREGTKLMMTDETGCINGIGSHKFCCPGDYEQPKCLWRGFKNSGACSPGCKKGEVEVGTLQVGCSTKHQSACCTANAAVAPYGECKWFGTAPLCAKSGQHHACDKEYSEFIVSASNGFGGDQKCTQGAKSFCCKVSITPVHCAWVRY